MKKKHKKKKHNSIIGGGYYSIFNNTPEDTIELEEEFNNFIPYAKDYLKFDKPVKIVLDYPENVSDPFSPTGNYNPQNNTIVVFIQGRHAKDILRSLSHELVHHSQNCRGMFSDDALMGDGAVEGYAQKNKHLRSLEEQAYGSMLLRDYEDYRKLKNKKLDENASDWEKKWNKFMIKELRNGR